jgi:Tfp pilus assembly protein PilN
MKLQTNFSFPFDQLALALALLGWGTAVLGLLWAVAMGWGVLQFMRETPQLKDTLEQIQENHVTPPQPASMPSPQELDDLKKHLKGLNALEVGGGRQVSSLLAGLENLLPGGARLLSFQQDQRSGEVQLVVEALSLEDLSQFLAALERDSFFSKVTLTKQSRSQGKSGNWIQFSVDLSEGPA